MTTMDWRRLPDLASRLFGGSVVAANDEFFAEPENLIKPTEPEFRQHTFTNKGQEYDGWETRRRRDERGDHDWVIIRLGIPGIVRAVVVDTTFFTGNHPPFASLEGLGAEGYPTPAMLLAGEWIPILDRIPLAGNTPNVFTPSTSDTRYTHVRFRIYPDGGVARLRVHGTPVPDPRWLADVPFDLAAQVNGGAIERCSDGFFSPPENMLQPGPSRFMGDGWETARRRDAGHDWAVIRLAAPAVVRVLEIDTTHYKGNAPDRIAVSGLDARKADPTADADWRALLPETPVLPDTPHRFRVVAAEAVTHLRLNMFPDGGVGRLRVYGTVTAAGIKALTAAWRTTLPPAHAQQITDNRFV